jgi:hypothetical protein
MSQRPGSALTQGMELVYASEGVETPWMVDSVTHDTTLGGRLGCVRIRLRTSPTQPTADTRAHCADSTTWYNWDEASGTLRAVRLLAANAERVFELSGGRKARYETGSPTSDVVGTQAITVLPTTITTLDSTGRAVSRLRERFAVQLATATRGTFESPDLTAGMGWRETRSFQLVAIRPR